jgi:hypothetical protein
MSGAPASLLAGIFLLAAVSPAAAQEKSQETLKQQLAEKLAEPWVANGGWITDYEKALEQANKSGKVIAAYFTRSYAP